MKKKYTKKTMYHAMQLLIILHMDLWIEKNGQWNLKMIFFGIPKEKLQQLFLVK